MAADMAAAVDEILALGKDDMSNMSRDKARALFKALGATKSPPWEKDKLVAMINSVATALKGPPTDLSDRWGGLGVSIPDKYFRGEKNPHRAKAAAAAPGTSPGAPGSSTPGPGPSPAAQSGPPGTPATPADATPIPGVGQETPEEKQARLYEDERRKQATQERIKKSQEKRKCQVCGNMARSSCPFRSCKSCCTKAKNQCNIHVLVTPKPPIGSTPDRAPPQPAAVSASSLQALAQARAAGDAAALQVARGASFRHVSGTFLTAADKVRNLREAVEKYQQEVADVVAWRERTYRSSDEAEAALQDEALGRYLRNCAMLEEVMFRPLEPGAEAAALAAVEEARGRAEAAAQEAGAAAEGAGAGRAVAMAEAARERMARFEAALDQAYAAGSRGAVEDAARAYCEAFGRRPLPPLPEAPPVKWRRVEKPASEMPLPPALLAELQGQPRHVVHQRLAQLGIDPATVRLPWDAEAEAAAAAAALAAPAGVAPPATTAGAEGGAEGGAKAAGGGEVAAAPGVEVGTGAPGAPGAAASGGGGQDDAAAPGEGAAHEGGAATGAAAPMEKDGAGEGKAAEAPAPTEPAAEGEGEAGGGKPGAPPAALAPPAGEGAGEAWELEPMEPEELVSVLSAAVVRRVSPEELVAASDRMQPRTVIML